MWNNKTIEWIDVELTSFCNIACPGCLRQEKKEQVEPILNKDIPGEIFSNANAARVYLWTKNGIDMTQFGLSKKDLKKLNDAVINNPELQAYADQLELVSGGKGSYAKPDAFWLTQGIKQDLASLTAGKNRENYLSEFNTNVDLIFSKANLVEL